MVLFDVLRAIPQFRNLFVRDLPLVDHSFLRLELYLMVVQYGCYPVLRIAEQVKELVVEDVGVVHLYDLLLLFLGFAV